MHRDWNSIDVGERVGRLLGEGLLSDADFDERLSAQLRGVEVMGHAFRLVVSRNDGMEITRYDVGNLPSEEATYARTLLTERDAVRCRCEIWGPTGQPRGTVDPNDLANFIEEMVRRHWGRRDPHTMLPYLKTAGVPAEFCATFRRFSSAPLAVLHTDLDNFKSINTEFGEEKGNDVLAEFAKRFRLAFADVGVTVRTGGDEFSAILGLKDPANLIKIVDSFRARMETEPFEAIGRINTCSIGLSLYPKGHSFEDELKQEVILHDARLAETRAKTDGRNRICLFGPRPTVQSFKKPIDADALLETALSARRIRRGASAETTASIQAAIRTRLVDEFFQVSSIEAGIEKVRNGLGLVIGSFDLPSDRPGLLVGVIDGPTWAEMVVSSLLEATHDGAELLRSNDVLDLAVDQHGQVGLEVSGRFVPIGSTVDAAHPLKARIGQPFYPPAHEGQAVLSRLTDVGPSSVFDALSPVLLLPIGDDAKMVADALAHLAAAVVDIDDRPARGGGLPDFWQSNLSRIIRAVLANPNITSVLAIGDETFASHTMSRLRAGTSLNTSELQRRLSMNSADLTAFLGRDLAVATVEASRSAVLASIGESARDLRPLAFENRPVIDQLQRSRRRLATPSPNRTNRLEILDGLRTKTLADAYPEALQLVRSAIDPDDHQEPRRGYFREMTGFKIVITDPQVDKVPDYWREEADTLESYYSDSFVEPTGPFGKRLNGTWPNDERKLMEYAISQTADAVIKGVPTRRINVPIVPDDLEHPLGLSSIQIFPRVRDGVDTLDLIFVWRTVDALVGFPFSAYGSIRWAEDFLAAVNERMSKDNDGRRSRLGPLTYIALSFHMYLHDGDIEIARTIVQDATV